MIHRTIWIGGGGAMISPQRRAIKRATGRLISGERKKKSGIHKAQDRCLSRNLLYEHGRVYSPAPPHRRRTRVSTGILVGWKKRSSVRVPTRVRFLAVSLRVSKKKKEEMWRGGSCAGKNKHQKRGATRATQFFHPWNHKKKKNLAWFLRKNVILVRS